METKKNPETESKLSSKREENGATEKQTTPKNGISLYKGKDTTWRKIAASLVIAVAVHWVGRLPFGIALIALDALLAFATMSGCLYLARKILLNVLHVEKYNKEKQEAIREIVFLAVIILIFFMFWGIVNWSNNVVGR